MLTKPALMRSHEGRDVQQDAIAAIAAHSPSETTKGRIGATRSAEVSIARIGIAYGVGAQRTSDCWMTDVLMVHVRSPAYVTKVSRLCQTLMLR